MAEQGKPLSGAKSAVIGAGVWLTYYANLGLPREVIQDDMRAFAEAVRRPLSVVATITPWNFR
jgi:acyl-CoA reductase-like NAD-dependent aldehyde dehydrogenase